MNSKIQTFLNSHYGPTAIDSLELLAQSGSSRKYYRFKSEGKTLILTESKNIEENKTFIYFTTHFLKVMNNLPKIDKISEDFSLYTQSDLGDQSLMNLLETDKSQAKEIFIKSVKQLAKLQVLGNENLDYSQAFSYPKFNYLMVLRDLFSFKNYFLNLSGVEFNQGRLLADFERFALDFEKLPNQYFVYRDFQSRNIMVHENEPFFIDYQGGMKGPVQYDLVSLLWQAKANLSDEWKSKLYEIYVKEFIELTQKDLDGFEFKRGYDFCLIERLLQVLGTYGFRGIYERKPHFLASIEFALKNLNAIKSLSLLENYPELKRVIEELAKPETFIKIKIKMDEGEIDGYH